MFELITAGGWMMAPIITCSVVALAIVAERLWTLQTKRVTRTAIWTQSAFKA